MRTVRIPACAKINLRLHIVGRRADGYHELRTIFQTISLHDTLYVSLTRGARGKGLGTRGTGVELECDDPGLSTGRENLVWRALDLMRWELSLRGGFHARLSKLIPVGRGLGGGSADAAAALLAAQRLTGNKVPHGRLLEMASALGADVPFFLVGGRALGVGRGDEVYPLADIPKRSVVVVSPAGIAVNTKDAYGWVAGTIGGGRSAVGNGRRLRKRWRGAQQAARLRLTKGRNAHKISSFCALCWGSQVGPLGNDFEPAVFAQHPRLRQLKRRLLQSGAQEASLAGSGSAVFGIYQHPAQARRSARSFLHEQTFVVETLSREEYFEAVTGD